MFYVAIEAGGRLIHIYAILLGLIILGVIIFVILMSGDKADLLLMIFIAVMALMLSYTLGYGILKLMNGTV